MIRILSFERVLEAFREHLTEDTGVEVVPTRHGYTYLHGMTGVKIGTPLRFASRRRRCWTG